MRRPWRVLLLTAALLATACATPRSGLQLRARTATEAGVVVLHLPLEEERELEKLRQALRTAGPHLSRWGGLREPVTLKVLPTEDDLKARVSRRRHFEGLRAWARYDEVLLVTPASWTFLGARQVDVDRMVLHELTHCVMFQQSATAERWRSLSIPLWFREGMASFTAQEGGRWPGLEDLARFYDAHPDEELLTPSDARYGQSHALVYGAAFHAFTFLVRRYGEEPVRQTMARMREGLDFAPAFHQAVGLPPEAFEREFRRYVVLRGFRGGRLLRPPRLSAP